MRNAGAVFVGSFAPVSLGDYLAGSNHVLPTGGCACHSSGLSVQSFLRGIHVVDYTRDALAEVSGLVVALANAEDLPAHGEAVTARFEERRAERMDYRDLPIRDDLRELTPYGAPQIDVPYPLNTNENPYGPPPELVADLAKAVTAAATTLNRYPDRDATDLRKDLADYLAGAGGSHGLTVRNVWAANGSNEVLQQILQVFGGPGRSAIGFEPSYSMHRLIALATATGWISGLREGDYTLDAAKAVAAIERHQPRQPHHRPARRYRRFPAAAGGLAALPRIRPRHCRRMRLVDDTGRLIRAPEVRFSSQEIGLDQFGYNIENRALMAALEAARRRICQPDAVRR